MSDFLVMDSEGFNTVYPTALEAFAAIRKIAQRGAPCTLWEARPFEIEVSVKFKESPQSEPGSAPPRVPETPAAGEVLPCAECAFKADQRKPEKRVAALTAHYESAHPEIAAKWKAP